MAKKNSLFGRSFELAKLSVKVGLKELQSGNLKSRIEQARLITESLSELKGAAMKAGQLLSLDLADYFPPEAVQILSQLQNLGSSLPYSEIRKILIQELGEKKLKEIQSISESSVASASIAQVHSAFYQGQKIKMDPQGKSYTTPNFIPDVSTKKVLAMSWENGISLNQWIQTNPTQQKKNHLAHLILNLYCEEFFHWGLVQTDPNFSNFLIQEDGPTLKLVILDFGATRVYSKEFIADYVHLLEKVRIQDDQALINYAIQFGMIDSKESDETKNDFVQMMKVAAEPFFLLPQKDNTSPDRKYFKFADKDYSTRSRDSVQKFIRGLKYSPPPHRIIFLHRKLGGIFALLKRLDVELDITPYWSKMTGRESL